MSRVPKKRQPFKLQILDLLLQIDVPAGIADEVASEVVNKSKSTTQMAIIRNMIIDSLRNHDAKAAKELEKRFSTVLERLEEVQLEEAGPAGEIYDEEALNALLEADEITAAELYFMEGYLGRSWQRKTDHFDTGSTELARDDRYED